MPTPASLATLGVAYTQNFDTLATIGSANTLALLGWAFSEAGSNANQLYAADSGSNVAGDTYSYGPVASTDRAFGNLGSGALSSTIGAFFENDTGGIITSIIISYTGEEWRLGTAGRTDRLDFQYSSNATELINGTWTDKNELDFTTPDTATVGAKNGNAASEHTALTATISGLHLAPGDIFVIRWLNLDASGADDGLAVDDFSLAAISDPALLKKPSNDINGDAFSDILFRDNSTGDTGYTDVHNSVFHSLGGSPTAYSVVGSGDYNGDGFSDILFRNNSTGDTGYTDVHNNVFHSLGGSPAAYNVVGSGDYNGDSFSDVLFRNNATGDTGYTDLHNNVFHSLGGSPVAYSVVGSGDYNGDGFSDILFRNGSTGDTGYTDIHNNVFHSLGGSPVAYSVVGSGDYNGDGFSDILFRNNSTGDTGYTDIHNNVFHSLGGSPVAYSVVASGDYNGDSFSDILFRNNASGDTGYTDVHNNVFQSLGGSPAAYLVMA